jgi:anti-sigma factor RsiW
VSDSEDRLKQALRARAPRYRAPDALRESVRAIGRPADRPSWNWPRWSLFAGALASACALALGLTLFFTTPSKHDRILQDIVSSHVRSIQVAHLTDVASSDKHTVKPWFIGKLDFSPPVKDFAEQGFPLVGGRMDYIDQKNVAALIYKHSQHTINLTVWPESNGDTNVQISSVRGYQVANWRKKGFVYWAVSDVEATKLREFASAISSAS